MTTSHSAMSTFFQMMSSISSSLTSQLLKSFGRFVGSARSGICVLRKTVRSKTGIRVLVLSRYFFFQGFGKCLFLRVSKLYSCKKKIAKQSQVTRRNWPSNIGIGIGFLKS